MSNIFIYEQVLTCDEQYFHIWASIMSWKYSNVRSTLTIFTGDEQVYFFKGDKQVLTSDEQVH